MDRLRSGCRDHVAGGGPIRASLGAHHVEVFTLFEDLRALEAEPFVVPILWIWPASIHLCNRAVGFETVVGEPHASPRCQKEISFVVLSNSVSRINTPTLDDLN